MKNWLVMAITKVFSVENYENMNLNTSNSHGCNNYYNNNSQTYHPYQSFTNSYTHLYWSSNGSNENYDGVLISKDHIVEENGNYRIMFNYTIQYNYINNDYNNAQSLKSYYRVNSQDWVLFDKSAYNLYNIGHTEFPISDLINLNAGDTIKIMLVNDREYYTYEQYYRIDDLKIEKVSGEDFSDIL